jgi:predicted nucleotidyltransferase
MDNDAEALTQITRRIVERFHPQRVVLFGSRARNNARLNSDFDILIVAPSQETRWRRTTPVYRELAELNMPCDVDVVWWTPEEIAIWKDVQAHFVTTALREGKTLYGDVAR